jgi:hypothetical protein
MQLYINADYKNRFGSFARLIKIIDDDTVFVEFKNFERQESCTKTIKKSSLIKETFKSPYDKTVYGIGYIGNGPYNSTDHLQCYIRWHDRLKLIYTGCNKNYLTVSIADEWHCFQNFADWYHQQIGHDTKGFDLDKDLLSGDMQSIYSPETCCFLPEDINLAISRKENINYRKIACLAEKYKHAISATAYNALINYEPRKHYTNN